MWRTLPFRNDSFCQNQSKITTKKNIAEDSASTLRSISEYSANLRLILVQFVSRFPVVNCILVFLSVCFFLPESTPSYQNGRHDKKGNCELWNESNCNLMLPIRFCCMCVVCKMCFAMERILIYAFRMQLKPAIIVKSINIILRCVHFRAHYSWHFDYSHVNSTCDSSVHHLTLVCIYLTQIEHWGYVRES